MKILIVDDEKLIVKRVKHRLEQNGFEVYAAYEGNQALDLIQYHPLDFILLDVMLPGMDGITLCKKICEKEKFPSSC
jgi:two-component system response regulator VicR